MIFGADAEVRADNMNAVLDFLFRNGCCLAIYVRLRAESDEETHDRTIFELKVFLQNRDNIVDESSDVFISERALKVLFARLAKVKIHKKWSDSIRSALFVEVIGAELSDEEIVVHEGQELFIVLVSYEPRAFV